MNVPDRVGEATIIILTAAKANMDMPHMTRRVTHEALTLSILHPYSCLPLHERAYPRV